MRGATTAEEIATERDRTVDAVLIARDRSEAGRHGLAVTGQVEAPPPELPPFRDRYVGQPVGPRSQVLHQLHGRRGVRNRGGDSIEEVPQPGDHFAVLDTSARIVHVRPMPGPNLREAASWRRLVGHQSIRVVIEQE